MEPSDDGERLRVRMRWARGMLCLAVCLFAAGVCLPWERVVMVGSPTKIQIAGALTESRIGNGRTFFLQVPVVFMRIGAPGVFSNVAIHHGLFVIENAASPEEAGRDVSVCVGREFSRYLKALSLPRPVRSSSLGENLQYLATAVAWIAAAVLMVAMPFGAGLLARTRLFRGMMVFFAVAMLVWIVWHIVMMGQGGADLALLGSGFWLVMAALVVEIVGLGLIPVRRRGEFVPGEVASGAGDG